jgi:hypothetical protein
LEPGGEKLEEPPSHIRFTGKGFHKYFRCLDESLV